MAQPLGLNMIPPVPDGWHIISGAVLQAGDMGYADGVHTAWTNVSSVSIGSPTHKWPNIVFIRKSLEEKVWLNPWD